MLLHWTKQVLNGKAKWTWSDEAVWIYCNVGMGNGHTWFSIGKKCHLLSRLCLLSRVFDDHSLWRHSYLSWPITMLLSFGLPLFSTMWTMWKVQICRFYATTMNTMPVLRQIKDFLVYFLGQTCFIVTMLWIDHDFADDMPFPRKRVDLYYMFLMLWYDRTEYSISPGQWTCSSIMPWWTIKLH